MKKLIFNFLLIVFFLGCMNTETAVTNGVKTPGRIEYNILQGMNYIEIGDYTNAIKELEKALKKDSKNLVVNREIAFSYSELGNYKKGEYYYKKVLEIDSKDLNSLENLANLYYKTNKFDLAKKYIDRIPEKEKSQYIKKLNGYIYIEKNELENAYGILKNIYQGEESYDNKFFEKYLEVLENLNKKEELYKVLTSNYSLNKNEREYVKIYTEYLDKIFNERVEGKRAIKRYLVENPSDSEIVFYLLTLEMVDKNYGESEKIALFINEEYKYDNKYIAILEEIKNKRVKR